MGLGALWGHFRALDRLQPWAIKHSIMTRGEGSWTGRSVLDVDRALRIFGAWGLRRLQHGFLSLKSQGLVHL
jgi:hypothetical protein